MEKIADGIAKMDLTMDFGDRKQTIHPTLLWDEQDVILVDTGYPGMLPDIRREMELAGVSFDHLTKVILTHQDYDHLGGLPEILAAIGHPIEVFAHEIDKPYIEGEKLLIKHRPERGTPPKAKVDTVLQDGDHLPYMGGIEVIFTPGHSPGHVALYHQPSKTLITGDAIVSNEGQLIGPNEMFTPDMPLAWKSIGKFTNFDIQTAICYHGGVCVSDVNGQFKKLAAAHA